MGYFNGRGRDHTCFFCFVHKGGGKAQTERLLRANLGPSHSVIKYSSLVDAKACVELKLERRTSSNIESLFKNAYAIYSTVAVEMF